MVETSSASALTLARARAADFVLSGDGSRLYVANRDGTIKTYDMADGTLAGTLAVGKELGAVDISPDGRFLLATERVPASSTVADPWWDSRTTTLVYKIDIATGAKTTFEYAATEADYSLSDIAILSDGNAYMTESLFPGWSGWTSLIKLDLATGTFSDAVPNRTFY